MRVAIAACAVLALSGCTSATETCVLWMDYSTPQEAFDAATLVVVGHALPSTSTETLYSESVPRHEIVISEVLKGDAPDSLWASPAPLTCNGPRGTAPLNTDDTIILLLGRNGAVWQTINPTDGVIVAPADGSLPFDVGP